MNFSISVWVEAPNGFQFINEFFLPDNWVDLTNTKLQDNGQTKSRIHN